MPSSDIAVRLRLLGAKRFEQDASKGGKAIEGIGRGGAKSARGLRTVDRATSRTQRGFRGLARGASGMLKPLAGVAAGYAGIAAGRAAVDTTTDLAKATIGLHKNLGLSVGQSSEWAAVAKVRGVEAKALNMSFGTLAKQSVAAGKGTAASADAFKSLGISQKEVKKLNFNELLGRTADGLEKMGAGKERTATTMKLFGRGWQTIVPVLRDGSKGMKEQLGLARKYGATFGGKSIKSMQDFISAQREQKFATLGLQLALGQFLIPTLTKGLSAVNKFVLQMRSGKGPGGDFAKVAKDIWESAKPIVTWFARAAFGVGKFAAKHPTVTKLAVAITGAGIAINAIRSTRAVKGIGTLLGALKRLAKTKAGEKVAESIAGPGGLGGLNRKSRGPLARFRTFLRDRLSSAGTSAGTVASEGITSGTADGMRSRTPRLKSFFGRLGKGVGIAFGIAAALAISKKISDELAPGNVGGGASRGGDDPMNIHKDPGEKLADKVGGWLGLNQHGGSIRPGRTSLVGEVGPELVTARAGSAFVTPLRTRQTPKLQPLDLSIAGGGGERTIRVPVYLNSRVLTEAVVKDTANAKARR